ncbi:MAG: hypothetical protein IK999_01120 [Ruminococcus sp.]|nr:hypothetical protein [Ruminococcus sp.]
MENIKVNKIQNTETEEVSAQCCCQIKGKSAVYEQGSCCKSDCTHWFKGNDAVDTIYH